MMRIIKSQSGMSLLLPVMIIGLIIITFSTSIAKMYITLNENNQRVVRGIAAIQIMQDFGVMALRANDLSAPGTGCPGGTSLVGTIGPTGFCWANPTCIPNPLGGVDICLVPNSGTTESAEIVFNIAPQSENPEFYARVKTKVYNWLKEILNASSTEAVAQMAGRDMYLPDLALSAVPANSVTSSLACVLGTTYPPTSPCKQCTGAAANLRCVQVRVCLLQDLGLCDDGTNNNWIFQRFGVTF